MPWTLKIDSEFIAMGIDRYKGRNQLLLYLRQTHTRLRLCGTSVKRLTTSLTMVFSMDSCNNVLHKKSTMMWTLPIPFMKNSSNMYGQTWNILEKNWISTIDTHALLYFSQFMGIKSSFTTKKTRKEIGK